MINGRSSGVDVEVAVEVTVGVRVNVEVNVAVGPKGVIVAGLVVRVAEGEGVIVGPSTWYGPIPKTSIASQTRPPRTPSIKIAPKIPTLLAGSGLRGVAILGMLREDEYWLEGVGFFDGDCLFISIDDDLYCGLFSLLHQPGL